MTSSPHGLYVQGYTRATMAGTKRCKPARGSQSQKTGLSSDWSLQLDSMAASKLNQPAAFEFGAFRLIPAERQLLCDDRTVPLPPKAFELLLLLVEKSGHLIEKEELIEKLWPNSFVEEANLTHHIWTLRKALGKKEPHFSSVRSVETVDAPEGRVASVAIRLPAIYLVFSVKDLFRLISEN